LSKRIRAQRLVTIDKAADELQLKLRHAAMRRRAEVKEEVKQNFDLNAVVSVNAIATVCPITGRTNNAVLVLRR
jgi:hypothetical protein